MIRYVCEHCDNLACDTSVCPVCGQRTVVKGTSVFWCDSCQIPCFDETCGICGRKTRKIGSDIRPVFPEEKLLFGILLGEPEVFLKKSVWSMGGDFFIIDGVTRRFSLGEFEKKDPKEIRKELGNFADKIDKLSVGFTDSESIRKFTAANGSRLARITDEAESYIRSASKGYLPSSMFVSFSGGKDSTITSDLVRKALGTESVIHIFGDTTLEFPSTHDYLGRFRRTHPTTPVLTARNCDQDFDDLCLKIGPPSRVLRWCCTVFKTGTITKTIEGTFGDQRSVLAFFGLRRLESLARGKYDRDTDSSKIKRQVVASPIIDWTGFDDWLYLLSNRLDFNDAYRRGYSRVGCWCCPNNSNWSSYLSSIYLPDEYDKFQSILYNFAKSVGKPDWEEYVDKGMWKARQGGNGLALSKNTVVSFKPCAFDKRALNFDLSSPIEERLYTLFKPFGTIDKEIGNKMLGEVYVLNPATKQPTLLLSGRIGSKILKVTIISWPSKAKSFRASQQLISDQITKFQTCIACGACQSVCRQGAIFVNKTKEDATNCGVSYSIDSAKCVHCLECVTHFDSGCYMKKVLRIKNGTKV